MKQCSASLLKVAFFFFNFVFWLSGLVLIVIGTLIYSRNGEYFTYADHKFASAEFFIIAVGLVVFVTGFLGCCGAIKENYFMVSAFAIILGIIFILEIVAGALGFKYKAKVHAVATSALQRAVDNYKKQTGAKKLLDWAQSLLKCCGNTGPKDYDSGKMECNATERAVASCHKGGTCSGELYKFGCKEKFIEFVKRNMVVIGGVAIGIAFIEILGVIFSCQLMKAIKSEYEAV